MNVHHPHRKPARSVDAAQAERAILRVVQGDGVVPIAPTDDPTTVVTGRGNGTVADLLAERGPLPESNCRAIGARAARALDRVHTEGYAHGDVKPSNLVFSPAGDLWLIDFDAAARIDRSRTRGTVERLIDTHLVSRDDDIVSIALTVIECATGMLLDPRACWTELDLTRLGCSAALAADVATVLRDRPTAGGVAGILQRHDAHLPAPPGRRGTLDPTPTIDLPSTAIPGLSPIGSAAPASEQAAREPRGWRRWARAGPG